MINVYRVEDNTSEVKDDRYPLVMTDGYGLEVLVMAYGKVLILDGGDSEYRVGEFFNDFRCDGLENSNSTFLIKNK